MVYSFDTEVAEIVGADAAVIFRNIAFWCAKNRANGRHRYDGRYWTYNSARAFNELFPWLSTAQVRRALGKLEYAGLIVSGCFNRSGYDRTKWYAVGDAGLRFADPDVAEPSNACDDSDNFHLPKSSNGIGENSEPIPDGKPVAKTKNIKGDVRAREVIDYLNDKTGKQFRYSHASMSPITARLNEGFTVDDCKAVIDSKTAEWHGGEMEQYLRPQTLFSPSKFEGYLNAGAKSGAKWRSAAETAKEQEDARDRKTLKTILDAYGIDWIKSEHPEWLPQMRRLGVIE